MKPHPFKPGIVVVRRHGIEITRTSLCSECGKPGRLYNRKRKDGRVTTYWQHGTRPAEEAPKDVCDWEGTGRLWCCKPLGHASGHHAHRGPRRAVTDAV